MNTNISKKLRARKREIMNQTEVEQLRMQTSPDTWKELQARASDVLAELYTLNEKGMVPESLVHVMDNLDTALCEMDHELHFWLGEWHDVELESE